MNSVIFQGVKESLMNTIQIVLVDVGASKVFTVGKQVGRNSTEETKTETDVGIIPNLQINGAIRNPARSFPLSELKTDVDLEKTITHHRVH